MNDQRATTNHEQEDHEDDQVRDIHILAPLPPPPGHRGHRREAWETSSHRSSSLSSEGALSENFTTMSREFNALVIAGSAITNNNEENNGGNNGNNLARIGEDDMLEETNPLAIVPDNNPPLDLAPTPHDVRSATTNNHEDISVQRVKKEEVETKITAWQTAKVAKVNNRYKREEAIINGWEGEQVQKATSWMKKVERKLEEKRARALEKMQNDVAKAHRKSEERRASAEAKRGTKVARVLEVANLMRAVGRAPVKRSLF
ncbi:Remorin, C-terminal [Dillenia turbinata]|uniref:Remorin, C-terminal n=1 Tax=Dillenia turbinata TaxID=194707 RepID=A0AAN8W516_9MAGN